MSTDGISLDLLQNGPKQRSRSSMHLSFAAVGTPGLRISGMWPSIDAGLSVQCLLCKPTEQKLGRLGRFPAGLTKSLLHTAGLQRPPFPPMHFDLNDIVVLVGQTEHVFDLLACCRPPMSFACAEIGHNVCPEQRFSPALHLKSVSAFSVLAHPQRCQKPLHLHIAMSNFELTKRPGATRNESLGKHQARFVVQPACNDFGYVSKVGPQPFRESL